MMIPHPDPEAALARQFHGGQREAGFHQIGVQMKDGMVAQQRFQLSRAGKLNQAIFQRQVHRKIVMRQHAAIVLRMKSPGQIFQQGMNATVSHGTIQRPPPGPHGMGICPTRGHYPKIESIA